MRDAHLVEKVPVADRPRSDSRGVPRARWLVIGVAALLVVALGSAAVVLLKGDRGGTSAAPSTSASPSATLSVSPASRLTWAPPVLVNPLTVKVTAAEHELRLEDGRDYRVVLPATPVVLDGGLRITGGRNVVLIGGVIEVPTEADAPDPKQRRGLLLKNQTGTVHVEGIAIRGADLSEGIDLDEPLGATVQLQNIAIDTVHGSRDGNHADLVQSWAGPRVLRIDGLSGSTQYQGLFLLPEQFVSTPPESFDLRRIAITGRTDNPEGKAGYLLWTSDSAPWLTTTDVVLIDPRRSIEGMVHPLGPWEQGVRLQPDDSGVRLPAGTPGPGYVTPGYQDGGG